MALPIVPVQKPADLAGQSNGKLDTSLMTKVNKWGSLHHLAADAWFALADAAKQHDMHLTFTFGGMYRSYNSQRDLFLRRYRKGYSPASRSNKFWDGSWWHLWTGAIAAVPGTSNHGWGLAIDAAYDNDLSDGVFPDDATYIKSHPAWPWLVENAHKYGFSWELQSEPWHIRYVTGDRIPDRVQAWKDGTPTPTPTPPPTSPPTGDHAVEVIPPTVRNGSQGYAVRRCQTLLWAMFGQDIKIDNDFGPQTEGAVKNVQRFFGLVVDGIVGPKTWGILLTMPLG